MATHRQSLPGSDRIVVTLNDGSELSLTASGDGVTLRALNGHLALRPFASNDLRVTVEQD